MKIPTIDEIEKRLQAPQHKKCWGDHTLNPDLKPKDPLRAAAVLIALKETKGGLSIIFTLRTAHLNAHAGQVSFPGGGADKGDRDRIQTALREAKEEIGLDPKQVRVLGTLDEYVTRTGYKITPVIGVIEGDVSFTMDENEVADIFEVPLADMLTPGNLEIKSATFENIPRHFYQLLWEQHRIWGPTAGILNGFIEAVRDDE